MALMHSAGMEAVSFSTFEHITIATGITREGTTLKASSHNNDVASALWMLAAILVRHNDSRGHADAYQA